MARRSEQRRAAAFAVYQADVTGRSLTDTLPHDATLFTRSLAHAADDLRDELDDQIARHAEGWSIERIAPLERSILRVALFELLHREDVPDEVAIDEAVEAAKELCGAGAPAFINGILGTVHRERAASP